MTEKEAYFLDRGLIGFLKHIDCLCVLTNRDIYWYIKNEIENHSQLQGMKFCREKTFYEWLRIGKIHAFNNIDSKKAQLYKEAHRLKNSMRRENQKVIFEKQTRKIYLAETVKYVYKNDPDIIKHRCRIGGKKK